MYCASCGQANDNNASKCVACGAMLQGMAADPVAGPPPVPTAGGVPAPLPAPPPAPAATGGRPNVPNHLVWAILVTLFCCLPGGIVAIVYAAQVDGKVAAGDVDGAQASARSAATWCWVSAGVGIVCGVLYFMLAFFGALARHH